MGGHGAGGGIGQSLGTGDRYGDPGWRRTHTPPVGGTSYLAIRGSIGTVLNQSGQTNVSWRPSDTQDGGTIGEGITAHLPSVRNAGHQR